MKKKIYNWLQESLTVSFKDHARDLLMSLNYNSNTEYQIDTFNEFKILFENQLIKKRAHCNNELKLINKYFSKNNSENELNNIDVLKDIIVNYESVEK